MNEYELKELKEFDFYDLTNEHFIPNNFAINNIALDTVFNNIPDIPTFDKIGIHMQADWYSFTDGTYNYTLKDFLYIIISEHIWEAYNNIWFWCCQSGNSGITQELSSITGATIKAPVGLLSVLPPNEYFVTDYEAEALRELRKINPNFLQEIIEEGKQSNKWVFFTPYDELNNNENIIMNEVVVDLLKRMNYNTQRNSLFPVIRSLDEWWNYINEGDDEILENSYFHPSNNAASRRQLWKSFQY